MTSLSASSSTCYICFAGERVGLRPEARLSPLVLACVHEGMDIALVYDLV